MNHPIKVHLYGSEKNGWALDTDLALTKKSLEQLSDLVVLTGLEEADVLHSVWEEPIFQLDQNILAGKRIICHVCNNFMRLHENSGMIRAADTVGMWVVMAQEAQKDLQELNYPSTFIPYSVDTAVFRPENPSDQSNAALRQQYGIPESAFLISNFMRDSFGHDLNQPKDQKGGEFFLEIALALKARQVPVHFLLAGPRRHWIRNKLREHGIPFTFIGKEVEQDDLKINIVDAETISSLYRLSDIHLVTSRWEGGPRSVLEAAATKTPILCTSVGIAPDILEPDSLYDAFDQAVEKLEQHATARILDKTLEAQYQRILERHTPEKNVPLFEELYREIEKVPVYSIAKKWVDIPAPVPSLKERVTSRLQRLVGRSCTEKFLRISLWHEFHKPPYGGGNQFMLALQRAMEMQGVETTVNKLSSSVDVHICNSCWFDHKKFQKKAASFPVRMIHRIDGPVTLYRGEGRDEDERIFELNQQFASATVFQSAYSFKQSYGLGFKAVSPVIIHNSVNDAIFNATGRVPYEEGRKIRLVSSAWSDNPRKGGAFLKWLDGHLDWDRFEYTFIGRVKEEFENIKHVQAVPSEELANYLRQHDMYLSVSLHEPCSNALLEALACGLPALYRNDGGNPELVSFGGLPFNDEKDVLDKLDRLAQHINSFQRLIAIRSIAAIASRYIDLARRIRDWEQV
ncbi:MAG: glycosyltransferase [Candidatus Electrothrix scaldis]|nr:MAG: glycosyltransferase [Candidatus Electrothrix sp. GW3-3]